MWLRAKYQDEEGIIVGWTSPTTLGDLPRGVFWPMYSDRLKWVPMAQLEILGPIFQSSDLPTLS